MGGGAALAPVVPELDPDDVLAVQPLPGPALVAEPAAVGRLDAQAVGVEGRGAGLAAQKAPACRRRGLAGLAPPPPLSTPPAPSSQLPGGPKTAACAGEEAHGRDCHAPPRAPHAPADQRGPRRGNTQRGRGRPSPLEHTKHQLTLTWAWCRFPFRAVKWPAQTMLCEARTAQPAARQASPPWYATGQRTQRIIFPAETRTLTHADHADAAGSARGEGKTPPLGPGG